jgi:hypothetical protein
MKITSVTALPQLVGKQKKFEICTRREQHDFVKRSKSPAHLSASSNSPWKSASFSLSRVDWHRNSDTFKPPACRDNATGAILSGFTIAPAFGWQLWM